MSNSLTVKSAKGKKRRNIIIGLAAFLVILSLILFVPYTTQEDCYHCVGGKSECSTKQAGEYLSGKKDPYHDCNQCTNGYTECSWCDGKGHREVTKNNLERLMAAI